MTYSKCTNESLSPDEDHLPDYMTSSRKQMSHKTFLKPHNNDNLLKYITDLLLGDPFCINRSIQNHP